MEEHNDPSYEYACRLFDKEQAEQQRLTTRGRFVVGGISAIIGLLGLGLVVFNPEINRDAWGFAAVVGILFFPPGLVCAMFAAVSYISHIEEEHGTLSAKPDFDRILDVWYRSQPNIFTVSPASLTISLSYEENIYKSFRYLIEHGDFYLQGAERVTEGELGFAGLGQICLRGRNDYREIVKISRDVIERALRSDNAFSPTDDDAQNDALDDARSNKNEHQATRLVKRQQDLCAEVRECSAMLFTSIEWGPSDRECPFDYPVDEYAQSGHVVRDRVKDHHELQIQRSGSSYISCMLVSSLLMAIDGISAEVRNAGAQKNRSTGEAGQSDRVHVARREFAVATRVLARDIHAMHWRGGRLEYLFFLIKTSRVSSIYKFIRKLVLSLWGRVVKVRWVKGAALSCRSMCWLTWRCWKASLRNTLHVLPLRAMRQPPVRLHGMGAFPWDRSLNAGHIPSDRVRPWDIKRLERSEQLLMSLKSVIEHLTTLVELDEDIRRSIYRPGVLAISPTYYLQIKEWVEASKNPSPVKAENKIESHEIRRHPDSDKEHPWRRMISMYFAAQELRSANWNLWWRVRVAEIKFIQSIRWVGLGILATATALTLQMLFWSSRHDLPDSDRVTTSTSMEVDFVAAPGIQINLEPVSPPLPETPR